jgi:outer membrane protein assembly factor BamB
MSEAAPHASSVDAPPSPSTPRRRWWLAALILAIGAALVMGVQLTPAFDNFEAHRVLATVCAVLLTAALELVWLVFLAGLSWAARGVVVAVVVVACAAVRLDGMSGNLMPHLAWRFSRKPDERLEKPAVQSSEAGVERPVDLSMTTPDDFPQFLGPNRDGRLNGPRLDTDWQAHPPRKLWRQPIGAGWSSFAVVGPYAVTQEQRGEEELVVCYEVATGNVRWSHWDKGRFGSMMDGIGPRATPTIAEGRVYTMGAEGRLNCLDGADGSLVWTHDVVAEHAANRRVQWGKSCSPLLVGELVVVSGGGPDGHSLVAYHQVTGKLAWHAGDDPSSYSSPVLTTLDGVQQILIVNHHTPAEPPLGRPLEPSLVSHDPIDGRVLWSFSWVGDQPKVPQPVPLAGNRVLLGAGYGIGCHMLRVARGEAGAWREETIWKHNRLKPKFTNLVVRDGFVYGLDDGKALVCLDLDDGTVKWKSGRYGHGQVLLVNEVLLIQAEDGEVALVEAASERHHELARFQAIDGKTWNNPALAGRYLLVRNAEEAACYELPLE